MATPARGPVESSERALAPDLARGFMLLLIALANVPWLLYGAEPGISTIHDQDGTWLDQAVQLVIITAVDGRVYPMFAFLFGYGMVQLYERQVAAGTDERSARRLLRRRNWWLLAFGFVHAALLWMGDILGAYGLAGLIIGGIFFRRRGKTLIVWASILTGLLVLAALGSSVGAWFAAPYAPPGETESFLALPLSVNAEPNYLLSVVLRLSVWPILILAQGLLSLVVPIALLLAFWAARRGVLERPGDHLPLLRRVAVAGIAIAWLGGLPNALYHVGALPVPDHVAWVFSTTQPVTGLAGGLGYVALFELVAAGLQRRGTELRAPLRAITAVGKRSLSCYLAQSVVFAPLLSAWGFGLGAVLGSAAGALLSVAVWLLTVVLAYAQERAGQRGPAEQLLRRLVYRRRTDQERPEPKTTS